MPMKYPPHPGKSILRDCMEPLGMSVAETAQKLEVSTEQLRSVISGQAGISYAMAVGLDKLFGGGSSTWYRLQTQYDEAQERNKNEEPEELEPSPIYQQTATASLEHGRVVYKTYDAEVIAFRDDLELSDNRGHGRVEFQFVGEGPGAVGIQMIYQPSADAAPSLVADVLFKTYLVWDGATEEYTGHIDASEWNRESQKLQAGKEAMNALHARLREQPSDSAHEAHEKEDSVERRADDYAAILREAEDLLYKGTASVSASALVVV